MGTVFENVRYGLVGTEWENAPLELQQRRVEEACKTANAHSFISELPKVRPTMSSLSLAC